MSYTNERNKIGLAKDKRKRSVHCMTKNGDSEAFKERVEKDRTAREKALKNIKK